MGFTAPLRFGQTRAAATSDPEASLAMRVARKVLSAGELPVRVKALPSRQGNRAPTRKCVSILALISVGYP